MEKVSVQRGNRFSPQQLYVYGTYKENGDPNFGLFCWISFCWNAELRVMACIGGEKLTKDRIRATGVFSANIVSEDLLPLADYFGNSEGYSAKKMEIPVSVERGAVLNVPTLTDSPLSYELEVEKTVQLDDSEIFICKIRNAMVAKALAEENTSTEDCAKTISPVMSFGGQRYWSVRPELLGSWGDWKERK